MLNITYIQSALSAELLRPEGARTESHTLEHLVTCRSVAECPTLENLVTCQSQRIWLSRDVRPYAESHTLKNKTLAPLS